MEPPPRWPALSAESTPFWGHHEVRGSTNARTSSTTQIAMIAPMTMQLAYPRRRRFYPAGVRRLRAAAALTLVVSAGLPGAAQARQLLPDLDQAVPRDASITARGAGAERTF